MTEVLRGWGLAYWGGIACWFGRHAWWVAGDWRDGATFTHEGRRYWGDCESRDGARELTGLVKIQCRRCFVRSYAHFEKPTRNQAWMTGDDSPRRWRLVSGNGQPVAGGPTHEEAEQELG